jgi:hypothetical protein
MVVVNCQVKRSKEYNDVLWRYSDTPGCPVQLRNIQSELNSFSGLEHHSPATASGCGDEFQIWAYCGAIEAIDESAYCLLGHFPQACRSFQTETSI